LRPFAIHVCLFVIGTVSSISVWLSLPCEYASPQLRNFWFLGVAEWTFGLLLVLGFWNKQLGILGALGACFTFIATATIIPFMPDGWAPSAGGFPAMTERVAFLMKDLVLLAASFYLLRQDVLRAASAREPYTDQQDAETGKERLRRA
jgi:uncharacterized membrane protein YphA (DoxX/SURF4 family)